MDFESEKGDEKNVLDYIMDIPNIWPFSIIFPKETPMENIIDEGSNELSDEEIPDEPPTQIIGKNLDRGVDYGLGLIHFVIKYEVNEEVLKVILFQGKNLVGKDPRGTSDPYAVISFVPPLREDDYKTSVKMKTLNPIWNHVFSFQSISENDLAKNKLRITLYDWDKYGSHEPLGEVYYDLEKLLKKKIEPSSEHSSRMIENWINTGNSDYGFTEEARSTSPITEEDYRAIEKSVSMILVDESFEEDEEEEEETEVTRQTDILAANDANSESQASKEPLVNIIRRIEIKKNLQALPNSRSAYGELLISLNYSIRTRRLIVTIIKAKNMIDPSRRSLIPYCTLRHLYIAKDRELTKSIHKTSYRFYTPNPVWDEEFQLKVSPDKLKRTAIEIQIFHSTKSVNPNDELLGLIRLGLKAYPGQKAHWIEFLSNIGKLISHWHLIRQ